MCTHCVICHWFLLRRQNILHNPKEKADWFGMFDGYDSCSEDTSSSSSSEESEEEAAPLPANLPIIKNNGQVYTYPDGKSGMGECPRSDLLCDVMSELMSSLDLFARLVVFYFILRWCVAT